MFEMSKSYQNNCSIFTGDKISVSSFDGNFQLFRLTDCTHLVMFAAGTGFTPMVKLINKTLVVDKISRYLVLFLVLYFMDK